MNVTDILPYCLIASCAFLASLSTFFSGFGLGTILLPVFSLFFSLEIALATAAIVHLINGLFKVILTLKNINWSVFFRFGAFAIVGAIVGSNLFHFVGNYGTFYEINIGQSTNLVTFSQFLLGIVMNFFAIMEFSTFLNYFQIEKKWIPVGGLLSGFFGGFSGHQGAIRSAFLSNTFLNKFEFIATSALLSVIIDLTRISSYTNYINSDIPILMILIGAGFAIFGSLLGNQLLKKTEMKVIKWIIGIFLWLVGSLMLVGFL